MLQEERYTQGEVLFDQGEEATHLFIVEEGIVNVITNFLRRSPDESQVPIPESLLADQRDRSVLGTPSTPPPSPN